MRRIGSFGLLCALLTAVVGSGDAAEPRMYHSVLEGAVVYDNGDPGGQIGTFEPLLETGTDLVFADIRGFGGWDHHFGVSWGLGWRHRTAVDWIVGGYGYFDRSHSEEDYAYSQGTLGVELLNERLAFRLNGYFPDSDADPVRGPRGVIRNGTLMIERRYEGAYRGIDFEAGALLFDELNGQLELRGYVGGYVFGRSESYFQQIAGPRARAELRLFDTKLLGRQSRLVLHAQYQWDEVRGPQKLLSLMLRVAFGKSEAPLLSRRERRMVTPVVRMPGVLTHIDAHTQPGLDLAGEEVHLNVLTASVTDLPGVIRDLGPGSVILLDPSDGPFEVSTAIVLQDHQVILGSRFEKELVDSISGESVILDGPDERPIVIGTSELHNVFELPEQGGAIMGVRIVGGRNGIYGRNSRDALIAGNMIGPTFYSHQPGMSNGILLQDPAGEVNIIGNAIGGHQYGIFVDGNHTGELAVNHVTLNRQDGVLVKGDVHGTTRENRFEENEGYGMRVFGTVSGDIASNSALDNGDSGLIFEGDVEGDIVDNVATGNDYHGIEVRGLLRGDLRNNTTSSNNGAGVDLDDGVEGAVVDNIANDNAKSGLELGRLVGGSVTGNQTNGNRGAGLRGGNLQADVSNNTANDNSGPGLMLAGNILGEVLENSLQNNGNVGMSLELLPGANVFVRGNRFSGNNKGSIEFYADMHSSHSGAAWVTLQDNTSQNVVPPHLAPNYVTRDEDITLIDAGGNTGRIQN